MGGNLAPSGRTSFKPPPICLKITIMIYLTHTQMVMQTDFPFSSPFIGKRNMLSTTSEDIFPSRSHMTIIIFTYMTPLSFLSSYGHYRSLCHLPLMIPQTCCGIVDAGPYKLVVLRPPTNTKYTQ
jgi:hypothetical protein